MAIYSYFILSNTNDATHFTIECTVMKDWRLRMSAMKSNHYRKYGRQPSLWGSSNNTTYSKHTLVPDKAPKYHSILCNNYCYYLLEKKPFDTIDEALDYRNKLTEQRRLKFQSDTKTRQNEKLIIQLD